MALYAVGDVQGCLSCLERLLERIAFEPGSDRLWLVGDLVNRGPASAETLRFVRGLQAQTVLGNHDLHLLAVAAGARPIKPKDTFADVLSAPDREALLAWLARQPLLVRDDESGWLMIHAGLPPAWDVNTAARLAREAEAWLVAHATDAASMSEMYGDEPSRWGGALDGMDRTRYVINAFTRLRFCDADSRIALDFSGPPGSQPAPYRPWFELWPYTSHRVVFGHWSRLGAGDHGRAISTDSGCVWGYQLTAARLAPGSPAFFSVECS